MAENESTIDHSNLEVREELDLGLSWYGAKDTKRDSFPFARLVDKMVDRQGMGDLQQKGFFSGNFNNDLKVLSRIKPLIADDSKHILFLLEQILVSRQQAIIAFAKEQQGLSLNEIETKIKSGEIPDPYPLDQIEEVFLNAALPGQSITSSRSEIHSIPSWWQEFSPRFREIIGAGFTIRGKTLAESTRNESEPIDSH